MQHAPETVPRRRTGRPGEIRTGAEGAACAGKHNDAAVVIGTGFQERVGHFVVLLPVEGVQRVGAVERDGADTVFVVDDEHDERPTVVDRRRRG